jgi:transcriptional regulator with XRE-family HTH domain
MLMFDIGKRIKEIRISQDLTQKEFAKLIGVSERGIQRYEAGERKPTLDILISILDNVDISADYLLGRTDTPEINR